MWVSAAKLERVQMRQDRRRIHDEWALLPMANDLRAGDDLSRRGTCLMQLPRVYVQCGARDVADAIHTRRFEAAPSRGGPAAMVAIVGELDLSTHEAVTRKVHERRRGEKEAR
jgi:hypothetical protein